jgi:hypothetical protein
MTRSQVSVLAQPATTCGGFASAASGDRHPQLEGGVLDAGPLIVAVVPVLVVVVVRYGAHVPLLAGCG